MGLFPRNLNEYVASMGIPRGPLSKVFLLDPVNGDDDNPGTNWHAPLKTLAAAEDLCTGDRHDAVLWIPGDTQDSVATTITWDKDHTHLIGIGANFPGVGQRCRIASTAAAAALTISAKGCIFKNFQVQNTFAGASGGVNVTGPYNYFENVYFNGINHATAASAATSYCLTVAHAENYFRNCTVGSAQTVVSSTNAPLVITAGANTFENVLVQHNSVTTGNFLVRVVPGVGGVGLITFKDSTFYSQSENHATSSTDVFNISGVSGTYSVLLKNCIMLGASSWSDVVTHVYHDKAAPATGGGISIAVNA